MVMKMGREIRKVMAQSTNDKYLEYIHKKKYIDIARYYK